MLETPNSRTALPFRIRLLRAANPLVAWILRSPLHSVLSKQLILLTFTGRKSGRQYTTPLSYVEQGRFLLCFTRPEASSWWRNLGDGARIEIWHRGRRISEESHILSPESPEALAGLQTFLERNPGTAELYDVALDGNGKPKQEDLVREVGRSIVVRIELPTAPTGTKK